MRPNVQFINQPKHFWANIRTISQQIGYTDKNTGKIKVPTLAEIRTALTGIGLEMIHLFDDNDQPTSLGVIVTAYFEHRANVKWFCRLPTDERRGGEGAF